MTVGLFGRGKRDTSGTACAACGRTLLAGELTQRVVDDDGNESLVCSLCSQPETKGEAHVVTSAGGSGVDKDRSDSDTFWRALKEKDAEIERLEARLARSEAERQEALAQLAVLQAQTGGAPSFAPDLAAGDAGAGAAGDASDVAAGAELVGFAQHEPEPPADEAEALAEAPAAADEADALAEAAATAGEGDAPAEVSEPADEVTGASTLGEALEAVAVAADEPDAGETGELEAPAYDVDEALTGAETAGAPAFIDGSQPAERESDAGEDTMVPVAGEPDGGVSSLTLLQRGVDILNVSPVPRKVADTSADLGVPHVHVGFDGQSVAVTFLWSLGWYRFAVDIEGAGTVRLDERGYDDRLDLQPNAGVRPDGTVQLAPAQISKAARAREQAEPAEEEEPAGPRTPRDAAERPPEIVSQSLLGQRTDDEPTSWEQTQAREFHW
jgi:hypothetical protein